MFKQQIKYWFIIITLFVVFIVWNQSFSFSLEGVISDIVQKYDSITSDDYLNAWYSESYSKDPFWDALKNQHNIEMHQNKSGIQSVWNALSQYNCSLSQKKINAILYYFSPEFRSNIAYDLKKQIDDFGEANMNFSQDDVFKYCKEYYACQEIHRNPLWTGITSPSARDVMTNCKEFFVSNYNEWVAWDERAQNLQLSQIWADRFTNATTDDSPYDIMSDFSAVATLLYEESDEAVQTVFYHLPIFSKTEKNIKDWNSDGVSSEHNWDDDWNPENNSSNSNDQKNSFNKNSNNNLTSSKWSPNNQNWKGKNPVKTPKNSNLWSFVDSETNDFLAEWLWTWSLNNGQFYGKSCDESDLWEVESLINETKSNIIDETDSEEMEFTVEEYEDFVEQMISNIDKYAKMDEEIIQEIEKNKPSESNLQPSLSPDDIQAQAEEIKNCFQKCEGLRIDQAASCMVMCSCGEWSSAKIWLFDPGQIPWLWPIFSIRFCAVPAESHIFSVWWKRIVSIEEWIKEIDWVVDTLENWGKLGMWVPQHNFLDSSTKKMNFGEMISFTLSFDFEALFAKMFKESEQYQSRELKEQNRNMQEVNQVYYPLNNPAYKNQYRLIGYEWENSQDISQAINPGMNNDEIAQLNQPKTFMIQWDMSNSQRYVAVTELVDKWAEQQAEFWQQVTDYVVQWWELAQVLYAKKG